MTGQADHVLFRCDVCGDIFANFVDDSLAPEHVFRVDADGYEGAPCSGIGHPLPDPPAGYCATCAIPDHDACSLTPGCPCCDDTIARTETP